MKVADARHPADAQVTSHATRATSQPLTINQQLAWIGQSYYGDSPLYNVPLAYWIDGPLDLSRFLQAFDVVVQNCDTLRLSIDESGGAFRQVVSPQASYTFDVIDVSATPNPTQTAREVLAQRAGILFGPNAPLFDTCIIRVSPQRHVWLLNQHHCITDGVTNLRLYDSLCRAYLGEPASEIFANQPSFLDYVAFVRARDGAERADHDERRSLPPAEPVEAFAPFGSSSDGDDYRAVRIDAAFGRAETAALLARARAPECFVRSEEATLLNLLVTAMVVLANKLQGGRQVALATALHNRNIEEFQNVPGLMMSMLPLWVAVDGSLSLGEVYGRVVAAMRQALRDRTKVVANSVERRLYDLVVNLPTYNYPDFAGLPVRVERVCSGAQGEAIHLFAHRYNASDEFIFEFTFRSSLFSATERHRIIQYYRRIVLALVEGFTQRVGEVELRSPLERHALLEWSSTGTATYPTTTYARDLFRRRLADAPDSIVAASDELFLSTDYVARRATRLAAELDAAEGEHVGLLLEETPELVIGMVGALEAGLPLVPLSPRNSDERLAAVVQEAAVSVIVSDEAHRSRAHMLQRAVPNVRRIVALAPEGDAAYSPRSAPGLEDIAYIVCTSGSTGRPKAVPITHANLSAMLHWTADYFGLGRETRTLQTLSFGFDFGVFEVTTTVMHGGVIFFLGHDVLLDPARCRAGITALDINNINLTPTLASAVLCADRWPNALQTMHLGGEAVTTDLVRNIERGIGERCAINNGYGPTEATVNSSMARVSSRGLVDDVVPIGRPTANNVLWVVDGEGDSAIFGTSGELLIAGSGVTPGYLDRPAQTAQVLRPFAAGGPGARAYWTGDRVQHCSDGALHFLGRVDTQVKIRGFRVEPGEIEAALVSHPQVRDAVVIARGSGADRQLLAYVVPRDRSLSTSELHTFAQRLLPDYMVPAAFVVMESLPVTASGKVDRKALPAVGALVRAADVAWAAPRNRDEEVITTILREVLKVERVGIHDNFFTLGGHSLLAAVVIARIHESLGVGLSLRTVFEAPTVAELARAVSQARGPTSSSDSPQGAASQSSVLDVLVSAVPSRGPERFQPFALTPLQQAYCIGRTGDFELSTPAAFYRIQEVEGLDVGRLERAIRALIERHDALRLIVTSGDEQKILESTPAFELPVRDLRGATPEAIRRATEEISRELRSGRRTVQQWPLWDIRVLRLSEHKHQVHIRVELLIMDGRSLQTMASELLQLYIDPHAALPDLPLSFRDYVQSVAALRARSEAAEVDRRYWSDRLATLPVGPDLPLAPGRNLPRMSRFVRRRLKLDPGKRRRLWERAQAVGLPPSAAILGAYLACIARFSSSPRFLLTVLSSQRVMVHPDVDQVVGCFTNTVLLEVDWSGGSFLERTRRAQAQLWSDLGHGLVSGVEVLRDLKRARGTTAATLSPVVLANNIGHHTRVDYGNPALPAVNPMSLASALHTPQVLLDHQIFEFADGSLLLNWDTVDEAFAEGVPSSMLEYYCALLESLADDADAWHRETPRLPKEQLAERERVNSVTAPHPSDTLFALFAKQARAQPERLAVVTSRDALTYGRLRSSANALAWTLKQRGVRRGELVAIAMEKGWEQVVGALAVLQCGAAYMPVSPELPDERLSYLLDNGKARFALTQKHLAQRLPWPEDVTPFTVDEALFDQHHPEVECDAELSDLAYVIYTSGSTGVPKGVVIDHLGAANTVLDINRRFGVTADDRVLALSELTFDLSVYDIFGPLALGAALVIPGKAEARDPAAWCSLMRNQRVSIWNSVPALMDLLVDHAERTGEHRGVLLRLVMMSGDWIPVPLPDRIRALWPDVDVISLGGATEASIWSIYYPIGRVDPTWRSIPYGRPLTNQTIHVLDEALEPRPVWVPGDLYIGGIGVARCYWGDEAKTRNSFIVHPQTGERLYRTGDHGRYLPDGDVEFLGRTDLQVKIQGYRIELGEIETALARHPSVREVVVVARDSRGKAGKYLVAYVVPQPHDAVEPQTLERFLRGRLPTYMVPAVYVLLESLPLSANGKVDRKALPDPNSAAPAAQPAAEPRDEIERAILSAWREALGSDAIGIHDDFFALGGNSLIALTLLGRLRDQYDRELPLASILEQATVAKLAQDIRERRDASGSALVRLRPGGETPIFCVHPVGGSVLCYTELAKRLAGRFSVFGLQSLGLAGGNERPLHSIPEMAARYVESIRQTQSRGAHVLVGWSMGGVIAYEMARQLTAAGEPVALVAAIDSAAPGRERADLDNATLLGWFARDLTGISGRPLALRTEDLAALGADAAFDYFCEAASDAGILASVSRAEIGRIFDVFCTNARALAAYDAQPCKIPLVLFRGTTSHVMSGDDAQGWRRLVEDGMSVVELPGDHYTILRAPSVAAIAAELTKRIT